MHGRGVGGVLFRQKSACAERHRGGKGVLSGNYREFCVGKTYRALRGQMLGEDPGAISRGQDSSFSHHYPQPPPLLRTYGFIYI